MPLLTLDEQTDGRMDGRTDGHPNFIMPAAAECKQLITINSHRRVVTWITPLPEISTLFLYSSEYFIIL